MKVLKLLISLSWCLGVCLQQILLVTFLGYPVDIMLCAISTIPNITYNQISDMIGNLVVLVSVEILLNINTCNLDHSHDEETAQICDGVGTLVHSATLADVSLEGFLHDQVPVGTITQV